MVASLSPYLLPPESLEELSAFANKMERKRLVLIGGTGLIGRWFLELFAYVPIRDPAIATLVTGRTRPPWLLDKYGPLDIQFRDLDFLDDASIERCFKPVLDSDVLFFLAAPRAEDTFGGMPGIKKYLQAIKSACFLIELAQKEGCRQPTLLFASSGVAVDGGQMPPLEAEQRGPSLFSSAESLSHGKRIMERAVFEVANLGACRAGVARIFSCYGPHIPTDIHYAVGNFIGAARVGEPVIVKSSGRALRSYIYATDLITSLLAFVLRLEGRPSGFFEVLNVGSEEIVSIKELAEQVASSANNTVTHVRVLDGDDGGYGNRIRPTYYPDLTLCRAAGVQRERISLERGLSHLLASRA